MKQRTRSAEISRMLGISKARGMEAVIRADLIAAVSLTAAVRVRREA